MDPEGPERAAVLTGIYEDGGPRPLRVTYTTIWVIDSGRWRLTSVSSSVVPGRMPLDAAALYADSTWAPYPQ
jgi:hypothetical protein